MKKIVVLILVIFSVQLVLGNESTDDGVNKLLLKAVDEGDIDKVKEALRNGADVNYKNWAGETVFNYAALRGHLDIVFLLAEKGAKINVKGSLGRTALMYAAWKKHVNIVDFLLKKDVPVDTQSMHRDTALTWTLDYQVAKLLVEHGADVNHANQYGKTALYNAAAFGQCEMAEYLIKKGADVNHKAKNGKTPLIIAKEKEHQDMVKLLIKAGARK